MIVKLEGKFSYINKYNKLVFVYDSADVREKLNNIKTIYKHIPCSWNEFNVVYKKNHPIDSLIGLDCNVKVKVIKYKLQNGKEGVYFNLVDIEPDKKYKQ